LCKNKEIGVFAGLTSESIKKLRQARQDEREKWAFSALKTGFQALKLSWLALILVLI
jgi:hypothetical protein